MLELRNAHIVDPTHDENGQIASLYVDKGRFVAAPRDGSTTTNVIDLAGALVLAGGIDIHTHIGGGKVNLARMLMSDHRDAAGPVWPTVETGKIYSRMGYTTCFEPAMLLSGARHTHLELADTPFLDSGAYVVVGNEDWLLQRLSGGMQQQELEALVAWTVSATQAVAVKTVNAGGINAFKFDQRQLDVDQPHAHYGVTPREIIRRLTAAVDELGLAHPLHVHASNLGMPGNIKATLATLDAAEGRRIHLTHAQFNCYSDVGPNAMGSGAQQLARYVNEHDNVTIDVGQVVFGQTVTISADAAAQFRNRRFARPSRWIIGDVECQAGCGVVPIRYRDRQYVHSLQWTIGLELMLLIEDPWRVFLTTDHPNGGPFTSYPHLMRLLMDRTFRQEAIERLHPEAASNTLLRELDREYTLDEIAITTRAAPARILGLHDKGRLSPGAEADLAAYSRKGGQQIDWQATFEQADCVLKSGVPVIRDGQETELSTPCKTVTAAVNFDAQCLGALWRQLEQSLGVAHCSLEISQQELHDLVRRDYTHNGLEV